MKNVGIYVHFPFCASKCKYCNFNSYDNKNDLQLDYFQAMLKEIEMYKSNDIYVDSIFIGGGTPSMMFDGCISTLISQLKKSFLVALNAEITIECNPNSVTLQKAREWKECGVNRVSVGLQTINQNALNAIGRTHTKKDYVKAVDIIKSVGFKNINTDCLIGLPSQKLSHVKKTLALVTKLKCSHVSVYSLILEKDTMLYKMVNENLVKIPKEEKALGMYNYAYAYLKKMGYSRYEVSNFAQKNCECKHNVNTWKMGEYLGFGAGAHGYFNGVRYSNFSSPESYIFVLQDGRKPVDNEEKLKRKEKLEETIMLGLRTKYGIDLEQIKKEYKVDLMEKKKDVIDDLIKNNLINIAYNKIVATDLGFTVLNKIILDLVD